jgi:hypothetical protein
MKLVEENPTAVCQFIAGDSSGYPDETTRTITLCDFASRGSIYD